MYTVYVLKSERVRKSYVGMTDDFSRRLTEHNSGKSTYTKRFMPWKAVHTEIFLTKEEASKREKYLKSGAGRRFLKEEIFS
jgi:putative endonuclease